MEPVDYLQHFDSPATSDVKLRLVLKPESGGSGTNGAATSSTPPRRRASRGAAAAAAALAGNGAPSQTNVAGANPRVLQELHLHRILLMEGASTLLPELVLEDESEWQAVLLLLKTFYFPADSTTPLRGQPEPTLVKVLRVAGRLGAQRCVTAAIHVLSSGGSVQWPTAAAVYRLSQHYRDLPASKPLMVAAANALHDHLGDLHLVWRDAAKREELLELPFVPFYQLLSDNRTRADSEGTIIYTLAEWLEEHPECTPEERSKLGACIRLPLVSRLYMNIAARLLPSLVPNIVAADAVSAIIYVEASREERDRLAPAKLRVAWRLPERPSGTEAYSAVLDFAIPLVDLKKIFDVALGLDVGAKTTKASPDNVVFGGIRWWLRFEAVKAASGGVLLGVFLHALPPPGYKHSSGVALSAVARFELPHTTRENTFTFSPKSFGVSIGYEDAFGLGGPREAWDDAAIRALAVEDGRVPCRATIFRV